MRILLVLAIAFIFCSCNNDLKSIGQDLVDNGNYVEMKKFTLNKTYTVKLDSFYTSAAYSTGSYAINELLIGRYSDNYSGVTTAKACFQIANTNIPSIDETFVLDSVTFNIKFNNKVWGDTINPQLQTFELYQLEKVPYLNDKDNNLFYNTHAIDLGEKLSDLKVYPLRSNMQKAYFKLNTTKGIELGKQIFEKMQYKDDIFKDYPWKFINYFKGLAIVPAESNNCILSIQAIADSLYMRFHFHKSEAEAYFDIRLAQKEYQFNQILNKSIEPLRSLDSGQIKKVSFDAAGKFALIQGLCGYMIKMELPHPPIPEQYSTIIKAEIELEPIVFTNASIAMPPSIAVYKSNDRNELIERLPNSVSAGTYVTGQYVTNPTNSEYNRYIFDVTDYYQRLTSSGSTPENINEVLLTIPNLSSSFNRAIIDAVPVLKIYYASYNN